MSEQANDNNSPVDGWDAKQSCYDMEIISKVPSL